MEGYYKVTLLSLNFYGIERMYYYLCPFIKCEIQGETYSQDDKITGVRFRKFALQLLNRLKCIIEPH